MSESQQAGNRFASNWLLVNLGHAAMRMGETAQASSPLFKSLEQFTEVGDTMGQVYAVEGLAGLAAGLGQAELAVRLYAWADVMRESSQDYHPPFEQAYVDEDIMAALNILGEQAYAAANAQGKAMTLEQAIALAQRIQQPPINEVGI